MTDRFAAEGYLADRPGDLRPRRKGLRRRLRRGRARPRHGDRRQARSRAGAARRRRRRSRSPSEGGKVGIVGYCFGGTSPGPPPARLAGPLRRGRLLRRRIIALKDLKPRVPTMLHFGEKDQHIPVAGVRESPQPIPTCRVHIYPADHGFNCDHRASYDAPSAALAWTARWRSSASISAEAQQSPPQAFGPESETSPLRRGDGDAVATGIEDGAAGARRPPFQVAFRPVRAQSPAPAGEAEAGKARRASSPRSRARGRSGP